MKNDKLIPKRRFKEFENDEAWEQRKFEEIFEISQGLQIAISERFSEPGKNRFFYITNEFLKSDYEGKYYVYNPSENVVCNRDDILMTRTGNTGIVVTDVEGCFHNNFFKIKYDKQHFDKYFICQFLSSSMMQKRILSSAGSSTIPDLSHKSFYKLDGFFPKIEEQKKISGFFNNLDNLITLHQRKLEKLKKLKLAYLSEMFPEEGEKYPKRRFAGFTDPWEQRKLKEVAEIVGGGTPSTVNPEYWNGDIDWYSPTEIGNHVYAKGSTKKITKLGLEKSSAKILPPDKTVLFTSRAGIGDMAILKHPGATNQGFQSLVLKEGIDTYFIYSMGHLIKKYAEKNASGSTFLEISGRTLGDMPILMPSTNEQQKIGTFFNNLDNLITLHQRKLKKLENIKKAYLNEMFV